MRTTQQVLAYAAPRLTANGHRSAEDIDMDRKTGKLDGLQDMSKQETNSDKSENIKINPPADNRAPLQVVADRLNVEVDNTAVTIKERLKFWTTWAGNQPIPPGRVAEAEQRMREFKAFGLKCALDGTVTPFNTELNNFRNDIQFKLQTPLVSSAPSFLENLQAHWRNMNELGWTSNEIQALGSFVPGGLAGQAKLLSFNADSVNLGIGANGRTVSRAEIRDELMPKDGSLTVAEWRESTTCQRYVAAQEASRLIEQAAKAEQVVRVSAGPARMIGKPL